jgi:hypothetical protein
MKLDGHTREMNERKGNSIDRERSSARDRSRQVRMILEPNESIYREIKLMARGEEGSPRYNRRECSRLENEDPRERVRACRIGPGEGSSARKWATSGARISLRIVDRDDWVPMCRSRGQSVEISTGIVAGRATRIEREVTLLLWRLVPPFPVDGRKR